MDGVVLGEEYMKIEICKYGYLYEIAVLPGGENIYSVVNLTKTEIRQLIKRLEKTEEAENDCDN